MNSLKKIQSFLMIILLLSGVGLLVWYLIPAGIEISRQVRAGLMIEEYVQRHSGDIPDHFACLLPLIVELPQDAILDQAIAILEDATIRPPNIARTQYLLGKAYCLSADYPRAVNSLNAYRIEAPDDVLGKMELGFAYFTWAQLTTKIDDVERVASLTQSALELESARISAGLLKNHGDVAYSHEYFSIAWVWYKIASIIGTLPDATIPRFNELDATFAHTLQEQNSDLPTLDAPQQPESTITPSLILTSTPGLLSTPTFTPGPALMTPFGESGISFVIYETQAGDSLSTIAAQFNTTREVLEAINDFSLHSLWVGDVIVVCVGCNADHGLPKLQALFLEEGQALSFLAESYQISVEDLRRWNGLGVADWVAGGRWLVVPLR